jgi:eukaryotic-like serine/threonine-protein kinase
METSASPGVEAAQFLADGNFLANSIEGFEIDGKYRIGVCLSEGHRQGVYETFRGEQPANVKLIGPETADHASELLAGFAAGQRLRHPHVLEIYDFGEASVNGTPCVYVVTERADENLADVLRERALDETETRQILDGVIPALEFLHEQGFVHGRVKPSEVVACGETVKLNAECICGHSSGLYAAPETADGSFGPAADAWSLAVLILESLTRSPYESEIDRLGTPFREMVEGGLRPDPQARWTVARMGAALAGRHEEVPATQAKYRRFAGLAAGGALAAAAVCVLLIRSAHQVPVPTPVTIQAPPVSVAAPVPGNPAFAAVPAGWAVVGAAYRRPEDAVKRQKEIEKAHPKLTSHIYAAGGRYLVLFGSGFSNETQAKARLTNARRGGAPRDSYLTRFR